MAKESFLIYKSFYPAIEDLSDEDLGKLFRALFQYQIDGVEPTDTSILMAFKFFKNQFRLDEDKYQIVVTRNKSNGSFGGRPKTKQTQTNPKNPVGLKEPKKPDNENDNGNDNEKEKGKLKFTPPQLFEVVDYFKENGYTEAAAIKAFNYYDVANWTDSKGNKVKNWKQKMQSVWFKPENKKQILGSMGVPIRG